MKTRLTDFARRHPAWALAGAVALGFGAARILKSAAPGDEQPGRGDSPEDQQAGRSETPGAVPSQETGGYAHG